VTKLGLLYDSEKDRLQNKPFAYYALHADNSIALFDIKKPVDKLITTIFPPPKSGEITTIIFSFAI